MNSPAFRNWSDLRVFLAVERAGSTLAAARALGMNHATVGRRLDALEHELGVTLFERDTRGTRLTTDGQALLGSAQKVAAAVAGLEEELSHLRRAGGGPIRLTAPPTMIDVMLEPVLNAFRRQRPEVQFDLHGSGEHMDMERGEADIAVRAAEKVEGDNVICRRLPPLRWSVFCAEAYAAREGAPRTMEDVARHPVIGLLPPVATTRAYGWFAAQVPAEAIVSYCNNMQNMRALLLSGAGVGPMVATMGRGVPGLVECFIAPPEMSSSLWLLASPQAWRRQEVRDFMSFAGPALSQWVETAQAVPGAA